VQTGQQGNPRCSRECRRSCGNICEHCGKKGHFELTVLRTARIGTPTSPTATNPMKGVTPHSTVLVCAKADARSIKKYLSSGIANHIKALREAEADRASRLPGGTAGLFALVGPQETDEQQRISQQRLLAAIEADEEANAGLLAPANRAHYDRAMAYSERAGLSTRDARIHVAADADLESSDEDEAALANGGAQRGKKFKKFEAGVKVCDHSRFSVEVGLERRDRLSVRTPPNSLLRCGILTFPASMYILPGVFLVLSPNLAPSLEALRAEQRALGASRSLCEARLPRTHGWPESVGEAIRPRQLTLDSRPGLCPLRVVASGQGGQPAAAERRVRQGCRQRRFPGRRHSERLVWVGHCVPRLRGCCQAL